MTKNVLAAALGFATRLPVRWLGEPDAESFVRARSLLPLVGALIGALASTTMLLAHRLLADPMTAAIVAVVTSIVVTGAMHEDGWADVCDGIGGGDERERVLAIMRDSRLGTFGVLGLVASFALRARALSLVIERQSVGSAALALIATHVIARASAVLAMDRFAYARAGDASPSGSVVEREFEPRERAVYALSAVVAAAVCSHDPAMPIFVLTVALAIPVLLGRVFQRWIGGVTGDCLGAIEQLSEIGILLVIGAGTWR